VEFLLRGSLWLRLFDGRQKSVGTLPVTGMVYHYQVSLSFELEFLEEEPDISTHPFALALLGSDNLVDRMLLLVCLVVGALTGLVGMFLGSLSGWADPVLGEDPHAPMFLISCVIGFSLAFILMGVVMSGVDSVIVCFAEAPGMFVCSHLDLLFISTWT
jgi:hypothetical protein